MILSFISQRMFLLACIFQFLSDILLFETTECLIMSFFIPNMIQKEVQSAGFILHQALQQIISSSLSSEHQHQSLMLQLIYLCPRKSHLYLSLLILFHLISGMWPNIFPPL